MDLMEDSTRGSTQGVSLCRRGVGGEIRVITGELNRGGGHE